MKRARYFFPNANFRCAWCWTGSWNPWSWIYNFENFVKLAHGFHELSSPCTSILSRSSEKCRVKSQLREFSVGRPSSWFPWAMKRFRNLNFCHFTPWIPWAWLNSKFKNLRILCLPSTRPDPNEANAIDVWISRSLWMSSWSTHLMVSMGQSQQTVYKRWLYLMESMRWVYEFERKIFKQTNPNPKPSLKGNPNHVT